MRRLTPHGQRDRPELEERFMFGIGMPEMIVIAVIALIVFGPGKLPDLGKSLGEAIRGFKKAVDDTEKSVSEDKQNKDGSSKPD